MFFWLNIIKKDFHSFYNTQLLFVKSYFGGGAESDGDGGGA